MPSIRADDLSDPRVVALLTLHFNTCHAVTPKGSAHALDLSGLRAPGISFWTMWDGDSLLATGALKRLDEAHGEVKSMHTSQQARRKGAGSAMLQHIMDEARAMGLSRLSLETGSFDFFRPAVALYKRHGFTECPPFGSYRVDPNSVFLSRLI